MKDPGEVAAAMGILLVRLEKAGRAGTLALGIVSVVMTVYPAKPATPFFL